MRFFPLPLLLLSLLLTAPARSQETDQTQAADVYFQAYLVASDGEQLAEAGNVAGALAKYQQAKSLLDDFAQKYPTWQPPVQNMRRQKVADAIASLQVQQATQQAMPAQVAPPAVAPAPAAPTMPAPAPTQAMPVPMPTAPTASVFPAPMPQAPTAGLQPVPMPVAPIAPGADPLEAAMQAVRQAAQQQINQYKQGETEALADVGRYAKAYETVLGQRDQLALSYQALNNTATQQQQQINQLSEQVKTNAAAAGQLETAKKQLAETTAQMADTQKRLTEREKSVLDQGKKLLEMSVRLEAAAREVADAKQAKMTAEQNSTKLAQEKEALAKQNDATMKEKTALLADLEKIKKERDATSAQLIGLQAQNDMLKKGAPTGTAKELALENARLKKELEVAKVQVAKLQTDLSKKDVEIGELRGQVTKLQSELTDLKKESTRYQTQVADLTLQLKETREKMVKPDPKARPEEIAEANLLRGIIMRQIRLQDRQQIQKEAVIADLSKMENVSKQLLEQVEQIGSQRITLTPEEQKLFTLPQQQEIHGVAGIQGTVMAKAGDRSSAPAVDPAAKSLETLIEKGNGLLEGQKYVEAIAVYEDVLRTDPKNASGFAGLAWAQLQTAKLDEAEVTLKKALAYEANNPTSHYMLGVTLFRRERMNEAMTCFEKSLELNGKNARARHYLGVITSKMGLAQRAEREFKASLAIDPTYADAHFNLAVLFITWDPPRWDDARKHYKDALEKGLKADPNIERLLNEAKATTTTPSPAVTTTSKGSSGSAGSKPATP